MSSAKARGQPVETPGQRSLKERLQPNFEKDGQGKDRQRTFASVIQRLSTIRSERVKSAGVELNLITQAGADQKTISECLAQKRHVATNQK